MDQVSQWALEDPWIMGATGPQGSSLLGYLLGPRVAMYQCIHCTLEEPFIRGAFGPKGSPGLGVPYAHGPYGVLDKGSP